MIRLARRRLWMAPTFSLIVLALVSFTVAITMIVAAVASELLLTPSVPLGSDRVIRLYTHHDVQYASAGARFGSSSVLDFRDIERALGGHTSLAAYLTTRLPVGAPSDAAPATVQFTTESFFEVLAVAPFLGDVAAARDGIVVSHRFWVGTLGRSPDVLGTAIRVQEAVFPVVAVLPPGFLGTEYARPADLWLPLSVFGLVDPGAEDPAMWRDERIMSIVGRLGPNATVADLTPALSALSGELQLRFPETNARRDFFAVSYRYLLGEAERARFGLDRQLAQAIALIVAILVLAYANVGNLFAVRSLLARREVAIRKALGATDARLIVEALTPLFLLVLGGAVFGTVAGRLAFSNWFAESPGYARMTGFLNVWTVGGLLLGGLVAMLLLGLVPAFWTRAQAPAAALVGAEHDLPRPHARVLWGLVAVQIAVACAAGGTAIDGFARVRQLERVLAGFDLDRVGDVRVELRVGERMGPEVYDAERSYLARIRALPGVEAVATAEVGLLRDRPLRAAIGIQGREFGSDETPGSLYDLVSPDYFAVLGLPLRWGGFSSTAIEGAEFTEVVVNEAFAAAYLRPERERDEVLLFRERHPIRIVGVVANAVTDALDGSAEPRFYLPLRRHAARGQFYVLVRTTGPAELLVERIGPAITGDRMVDRALAFEALATRRERLIAPVRVIARTMLLAVAAIIALASIGTYGILAVSLVSTRRATAIRLALGSPPGTLARRALRPALVALGIGGALALALTFLTARSGALHALGPTGVLIALPLVAGVLLLAVAPLIRRVLRSSPAEILRL